MALEQLLETINIKNLDSPEVVKPARKFPWEDIPPDMKDRVIATLESRDEDVYYRSMLTAALMVIDPQLKPSDITISDLRENYKHNLNLEDNGYVSLQAAADAYIVAPDLAIQHLQTSMGDNYFNNVMQPALSQWKRSIIGEDTTWSLLIDILAFPNNPRPQEELDSIKDTIENHLNIISERLKSNPLQANELINTLLLNKLLYPHEKQRVISDHEWSAIDSWKNKIATQQTITDLAHLKMYCAEKIEFTENGLRLTMPQDLETTNSNSIPPVPAVKKL